MKTKERGMKVRHKCYSCKQYFSGKEIEFAPDPFADEILGDCRKVWECNRCREESAQEI